MKLNFQKLTTRIPNSDLLVLAVFEGEKVKLPAGVELAKVATTGFKGELREVRACDALKGPADRVLLVGLGKLKDFDAERARRTGAIASLRAETLGAAEVVFLVPDALVETLGAETAGVALAEGACLGAYRYDQNKSKPKEAKLKSVTLLGAANLAAGVTKGTVLAEANAFARDLQNKPANLLTPSDMADAAEALEKPGRVSVRVFDKRDIEKLGMGLLLGVAAGSRQPPRLLHLTYKPKGKAKGRVALVGKGLTFDSGGISIKPSAKMDEMRYDMSGAAAVLGVFHALRKLDVPYEVHGVCACTENMPGGEATKPGDIHTAMNGTTVEILNTDAEGRLVLADALCYVNAKIKPDVTIDLATLTGAVVVALGHELSGMFASTPKLEAELRAAGEETGERLWPLPLLDVHKDAMKGVYADLKNISGGDLGAGSSAGAGFLAPFAGDKEWAHLDIAGTAWGGSARDWVGGPLGSGVGTRLLVRWLETR